MCDCQSPQNINLKNLITSTIGSVAASVPFLVHFAGPLGPQVINVTNNTDDCGRFMFWVLLVVSSCNHPPPTHVGLLASAQLIFSFPWGPLWGSAACPHPLGHLCLVTTPPSSCHLARGWTSAQHYPRHVFSVQPPWRTGPARKRFQALACVLEELRFSVFPIQFPSVACGKSLGHLEPCCSMWRLVGREVAK